MIDIILIIYLIGSFLIGFVIGGAWIQAKETKFGIIAKFNCDNCEASGCQAKWCEARRNK